MKSTQIQDNHTNSHPVNLNLTLTKLQQLSIIEPKTNTQILLKLMEESGELAQEVGIHEKVSGFSYKSPGKDGIHGECTDVTITALSLFFKTGGTLQQLETLLNQKMTKWESKMEHS
jgi:NTP pyrophosphatase (non-canonical NTP hydrolase)